MSGLTIVIAVVAAIFALEHPGHAQQDPATTVALVGGTLIDGLGAAPIQNSVVLVRGDRIERVGTVASLPVPSGYERISTEGMTVLPGLWDMHVHLVFLGYPSLQGWLKAHLMDLESVVMPAAAEQLLMAGVTSARDLAASKEIFAVKRRIDRGEIPGPTMYVAGPQFTRQAADWAVQQWGLNGPEDARAKTRELLDSGAAVVKFISAERLTTDEMRAVVEEARARGKMVLAHGRSDAEIRVGLAMDVDELEHIGTGSPEYPADVMDAIRKRTASDHPLYWCPTVTMQFGRANLLQNPEGLDDPDALRGLPQAIADEMRAAMATYKPQAENLAAVKRKVAQLREAGVRLVFGTDGGEAGLTHPHATSQELDFWVRELGIAPMVAIQHATSMAAEMMGVGKDYGSVTGGKYADIIAVRGDPLRHINVLRSPTIVIKHGRRYK